ncbi:helix-turn-helix domain-containing protein [Streptomyces sp. NBC_01775]|uniref:helix-turn-helix domain-containing protein n=1 Tax=Streptomyces sp. NBC_01775 TaxID=2975939 RepID=UPI002DD94042|nr:helix-turn-helix domain-containing protein [Streptomyces sp. NBC_01775]WSB78977.1 helix-turn-helix domain-containing protein [Streptomyces sp. NBC_01775]
MSQDSTNGPVETRKLAARRRREIVAVLLFSGGPIFESSIPLSVFGIDRQDAGVPRYRLLVCAGEDGPLRTTGGLQLSAPFGLEAISRAGTVVVPAWRSITQPPPTAALDALRRAHEEGARVIGLCTGAFVLAAAGLLDGRPATTHWMYAPTLAKRYPAVHVDPRELFVDDGDILTSAGTAAGIDLCLHVVRTDHGAEAAGALARRLVVPPRRGNGQETGGHPRHLDRSLPEEIGADPLAEVVAWALEHLHEQFDVETLAARAYMSRRTFDRRFRSLTGSAPLQWLITQRVLQAQRLLETSDYSVDEVAGRCGFRSPVALRGHFRRQLGASPAAYRAAYRARRPEGEEGTESPLRLSQAHTGQPASGAMGPGGAEPGTGSGGGPGSAGGSRPEPGRVPPEQRPPSEQRDPREHRDPRDLREQRELRMRRERGARNEAAEHGQPGPHGSRGQHGSHGQHGERAEAGEHGQRREAREARENRDNSIEPGKPDSDVYAPRLPGQRGRGAG